MTAASNKVDLNLFLNSLPFRAAIINKEGTITTVNKNWQNFIKNNDFPLTQLKPEVDLGQLLQTLSKDKDTNLRDIINGIQAVLTAKRDSFNKEYSYHSIEEKIWYKIRIKPFKDGALLLHEDITAEKKMKDELKELTTEYQKILDNVHNYIFLLEVNNEEKITFKRLNKAEEELLGIKTEEIRGKTPCEALGPEVGNQVEKNYRKCVKRQDTISYEETLEINNEEKIWLTRLAPIINDGKVEKIVGASLDITESRKEKKKLEAIFQASKDISFVIAEPNQKKTDFIIKELSPGGENIYGYQEEEVIGESVSLLHPEPEHDKIGDIVNKISQNKVWQNKLKGERKSGEEFSARLSIYPFNHPQNKEQVLGVTVDIDELEKTKKELQYISFHDQLTELYNRKYMEEEIDRLDTARKLPISFIMIDINGLKMINDTFGHEKGDELLIQTAELLKDTLRKEDIVARWAGDEFVILLPQTTNAEAKQIKKRIHQRCVETHIEGRCPPKPKDDFHISLGMGTAVKETIDQDIYDTLNLADKRMYQNKISKSQKTKSKLVKSLVCRLDKASNESSGHALRMTRLSFKLGEKLNLADEQFDYLAQLARLHDVGKVTIPQHILKKTGTLNQNEWKTIKKHPTKGAQIASSTEEFAPIAKPILHHHENWAGNGYPSGLSGTEIPLLSRIIKIVDAYDVMTNDRPYSKAMSKKEAIKELRKCAGEQFDPHLVKDFIEVLYNYPER